MFLIGTHIQEIDKSSYNLEKTAEKVSEQTEPIIFFVEQTTTL